MSPVVYVIHRVLDNDELSPLRREVQTVGLTANIDEPSIDLFEGNLKLTEDDRCIVERYFQQRWHQLSPSLDDRLIIQNVLMAKLSALVRFLCDVGSGEVKGSSSSSERVYLFNEHYITKGVGSNVAFRWHRDGDEQLAMSMSIDLPEYYSCWVALDDVTISNGCLFFRPQDKVEEWDAVASSGQGLNLMYHRSKEKDKKKHRDEDMVGDDQSNPEEEDVGTPIEVAAGSVVLFSSSMWHRSSVNITEAPRRVLYVQYSLGEPITSSGDGKAQPLCFAVPCTPVRIEMASDASSAVDADDAAADVAYTGAHDDGGVDDQESSSNRPRYVPNTNIDPFVIIMSVNK